jgi:hypothetical protein
MTKSIEIQVSEKIKLGQEERFSLWIAARDQISTSSKIYSLFLKNKMEHLRIM